MIRIEILCTGDEILTGKTINTNYAYMARGLADAGLQVTWGTSVGDDRETLVAAMLQAASRSDAVLVNGGLGPTVDDLSQEVAAQAAGVPLELDEGWLERIESYYASRGREMPRANRKQAMLPRGCRILDNPIGTACGFRVSIAGTPFFFTPGVPRELHRMFDEIVLPQLRALSGIDTVSRLKRFHTFGIGESRADELLQGVPGISPAGGVKLGFQSHYPQLETKLTVHAADDSQIERMLAPAEAEVRRRLGHFVVAEDEQKLEGRILEALTGSGAALATIEMYTGGDISSRLNAVPGSAGSVKFGMVSQDPGQLAAACGLDAAQFSGILSCATARSLAEGLRTRCGVTHALAVLAAPHGTREEGKGRGDIYIGIASGSETVERRTTLVGGDAWIRLGATELGLDCLRRYLYGLPVDQRIDFEIR